MTCLSLHFCVSNSSLSLCSMLKFECDYMTCFFHSFVRVEISSQDCVNFLSLFNRKRLLKIFSQSCAEIGHEVDHVKVTER